MTCHFQNKLGYSSIRKLIGLWSSELQCTIIRYTHGSWKLEVKSLAVVSPTTTCSKTWSLHNTVTNSLHIKLFRYKFDRNHDTTTNKIVLCDYSYIYKHVTCSQNNKNAKIPKLMLNTTRSTFYIHIIESVTLEVAPNTHVQTRIRKHWQNHGNTDCKLRHMGIIWLMAYKYWKCYNTLDVKQHYTVICFALLYHTALFHITQCVNKRYYVYVMTP